MTRFTPDNTEGYTADDLAALNAEFNRRVTVELGHLDDEHDYDKSLVDHLAERVLADFDSTINDDNDA